ncbi:response regulator [Roseivirga sp. E12]|uniref:response regulator n=1 Tax=Roseivirga sp. E12 TaxID=2819237 RepID=UPI001ABCD905|nr:response regulator [Roseivirga sp. E12]MBO3696941.1 response regulator [Roseivirga sp. E12]
MKRQLLIVDDERSSRRLLEFLLVPYYNVVCMSNGSDALKWLSEGNSVDVIITDYEMPMMNGVEFVTAVRKSTILSHMEVIVLSSARSNELNIQFDDLEVGAFLSKPVDPKSLFWRVEESLGKLVTH